MRRHIAVAAFALKDGSSKISIERIPDYRIDAWRRQIRTTAAWSSQIEDWQSAVFEDLADAKSGIMQTFGLDWFNRARRQLDAIVEI